MATYDELAREVPEEIGSISPPVVMLARARRQAERLYWRVGRLGPGLASIRQHEGREMARLVMVELMKLASEVTAADDSED